MTYEGKWLVPGLLFEHDYSGHIEIEDLERSIKRFNEEIGKHPGETLIHLLTDVTGASNLLNPKSLAAATKTPPPARLGWVLLVTGSDSVLQKVGSMIISVMSQLLKFRFRTFVTREDALLFLAGVDDQVKLWLQERQESPS
jgi:hypothetical protein